MARPMSEEKKREKTLESLKKALSQRKMSDKYLTDKVEEYMSFYDDLFYINQTLIKLKQAGNCTLKSYTDATAEKRRISSEMRNILTFLGLRPEEVELPGKEEDEAL